MNLLKLIKREILITILSITIIVSFFGLITYAYFMDIKETDLNVIKFGDIELSFCADTSCDNTISNIGRVIGRDAEGAPLFMYPQTQEEALVTVPYIFKLSNTGDLGLDLTIRLEKEENPTLASEYSDYTPANDSYIYTAFGEQGKDPIVKKYTELEDGSILLSIYLKKSQTKIFNLWTWLKEDAPNEAQGTYFIADISVNGKYNSSILFSKILEGNTVKTTADFTKTSEETGEFGLYQTNGKKIYYFRGGDHCENSDSSLNQTYLNKSDCESASLTWVTLNNNIIFANKCWQIIRTNENGSVRTIYNGEVSEGKCLSTGLNVQIDDVAYNPSTKTINSKTYVINNDATSVGYTLSSPVSKQYIIKKSIQANDDDISYGDYIGTGYTFDEETGYITLTGAIVASANNAPDKSTYKYSTRSSNQTRTQIYEIASDATITHNTSSQRYDVTKLNKISAVWTKSEAEATANEMSSRAKELVDLWYIDNLNSFSNLIDDSGFCNDRTIYNSLGYGDSANFKAKERISDNKNPIFLCPNSKRDLFTVNNKKGNKYLDYPIGLITVDELVFAGGVKNKNISTNYYLNAGINFWTISPYDVGNDNMIANNWYLLASGKLTAGYVSSDLGIRPVISLKSCMNIESGTGSKDNPYVINSELCD